MRVSAEMASLYEIDFMIVSTIITISIGPRLLCFWILVLPWQMASLGFECSSSKRSILKWLSFWLWSSEARIKKGSLGNWKELQTFAYVLALETSQIALDQMHFNRYWHLAKPNNFPRIERPQIIMANNQIIAHGHRAFGCKILKYLNFALTCHGLCACAF